MQLSWPTFVSLSAERLSSLVVCYLRFLPLSQFVFKRLFCTLKLESSISQDFCFDYLLTVHYIFLLLGGKLCAFVTHDVLCLNNFQVPHRLALLHCGHFIVNVTNDCITLFYFIMPETFLITFHIFSHI